MWKCILLSLSLTGCATSYKDLSPAKIKPGEGVAVGRIHVMYNGLNYTENCAVCLNSTNGPCQKLDASGILFINLPVGEGSLRRLVCQDKSPQHFNITGAAFKLGSGVTYIGDVGLDWKNKGGFKVAMMFGVIGALADESSNDGVLRMSVRDRDAESLMKVYRTQMSLPNATARKNLVGVGANTSVDLSVIP